MRQGIILSGLGVAMWAIGTLFFLLFGGWVVLEVNDPYFGSSLFLLEMLTFLLLIGISLIIRLKLFREKGSATRFGYTATTLGLLLSTLTIWYRDSVFTGFTEGQHHGFMIWLTLTGALTLLVPAIVDRFVRDPAPIVEVPVLATELSTKELPSLKVEEAQSNELKAKESTELDGQRVIDLGQKSDLATEDLNSFDNDINKSKLD